MYGQCTFVHFLQKTATCISRSGLFKLHVLVWSVNLVFSLIFRTGPQRPTQFSSPNCGVMILESEHFSLTVSLFTPEMEPYYMNPSKLPNTSLLPTSEAILKHFVSHFSNRIPTGVYVAIKV